MGKQRPRLGIFRASHRNPDIHFEFFYDQVRKIAETMEISINNLREIKPFLTNNNITLKTRQKALQCYIQPILMYGCEAWTIDKQTQRRLEAVEMWFLRRMLRLPWTAKKTNEMISKEAETNRSLVQKIRKQ